MSLKIMDGFHALINPSFDKSQKVSFWPFDDGGNIGGLKIDDVREEGNVEIFLKEGVI